MRQVHSTKWNASVQPRKQRKYLHNAPLHLKGGQLHIHLSKELREKHGVRALRVRTGDTIKVLRGTHKGKQGKVERVDLKNGKIHVAKIETKKLQGGSAKYPLRPSNCLLVAIVSDKRRFKNAKETVKTAPTTEKPAVKVEQKTAEPAEKSAATPVATKPAPKTDNPAATPAEKN